MLAAPDGYLVVLIITTGAELAAPHYLVSAMSFHTAGPKTAIRNALLSLSVAVPQRGERKPGGAQ